MRLRPPTFWHLARPNLISDLLLPISKITHYCSKRRQKRPSHKLPVPVLCCGNITTGGTGKTPLTQAIVKFLLTKGYNPHIITRGYGGKSPQNKRLDIKTDTAINVGDEAMLLAHIAPTWRGPNRLHNARLAIDNGADCLILDDGLQDPSLYKDISILTIDGHIGFGNHRILPAGPLRETLPDALPRIHAAVIIGEDHHHIKNLLSPHLPVAQAFFLPGNEIHLLKKQPVIAFAGIGRPDKFFTMLQEHDVHLAHTISFPDHHIYSFRDIKRLQHLARTSQARLVTTEKDSIKLPPTFLKDVTTISVELHWQHPTNLEKLLESFLNARAGNAC